MLYFDGVHLAATGIPELKAWARSKGIPDCWYHRHPRHPHYDLKAKWAPLALADPEVQQVSSRELVRQCYGRTDAMGHRWVPLSRWEPGCLVCGECGILEKGMPRVVQSPCRGQARLDEIWGTDGH